jgi:hypothetical protein
MSNAERKKNAGLALERFFSAIDSPLKLQTPSALDTNRCTEGVYCIGAHYKQIQKKRNPPANHPKMGELATQPD